MDFKNLKSFKSATDNTLKKANASPFKEIDKLSIFTLKNQIDIIRKTSSIRENLEGLINSLIKLINYRSIKLLYSSRYPFLYRAVISESNELSKLSYKKAEIVNSIGRCHNLKESIFYCSNFYATSILEINPNEGDVVTILVVDMAKGEDSPYIPIITTGKNLTDQGLISNFIGSENAAQNEKLNLIDNFFNEIMLTHIAQQNEHLYYKTIALSKALWSTIQNDAAIVYPSKASKHFGLNFAIPSPTLDAIPLKSYFAFKVKIVAKRSQFDLDIDIVETCNKIENDRFNFQPVYKRNVFTIDEAMFFDIASKSKRNFNGNNFNNNWHLPPFFNGEFFIK